MQSYVQRRRQLDVFRPRQPRNDVNAGATPVVTEEAAPEGATPEERQDLYTKRCAQRHLI
ncbi:MAG TPA: hypothetical protein VEH07_03730 [Alphaproteobacteria bacterium]|nr:hypothetical protein [Alphaproteobacteria bacterium]